MSTDQCPGEAQVITEESGQGVESAWVDDVNHWKNRATVAEAELARPKRPGVDWPTPCPCEARRQFSQYQLGRLLEESPKTLVRVNELKSKGDVSYRVFNKLHRVFPEVFR